MPYLAGLGSTAATPAMTFTLPFYLYNYIQASTFEELCRPLSNIFQVSYWRCDYVNNTQYLGLYRSVVMVMMAVIMVRMPMRVSFMAVFERMRVAVV